MVRETMANAQFDPDALAGPGIGGVMDGVLGEMELAALPSGAAEHGPPGGAQPGVVVGADELDAPQAAGDQAVQKAPPVDLGLRQGHGDAEHPPPLVRADADGREDGGVAHHAAMAHLLVARVEDEVLNLAKRSPAPGVQFLVKQLGAAADLRG